MKKSMLLDHQKRIPCTKRIKNSNKLLLISILKETIKHLDHYCEKLTKNWKMTSEEMENDNSGLPLEDENQGKTKGKKRFIP
ncbi:hypothetical protein EUGRSUZ_A01675 [Eucalyptus grandis]|uniref:Uncharacterized protein n=2 Tax=Eucalyptus grandis TaxID=71139 RepID=A0ACC3M3R3_EUCGR|nr:hypothetical protein EUGRSUZ_A01675 [Eucalyptus grandis]